MSKLNENSVWYHDKVYNRAMNLLSEKKMNSVTDSDKSE